MRRFDREFGGDRLTFLNSYIYSSVVVAMKGGFCESANSPGLREAVKKLAKFRKFGFYESANSPLQA